MADVVAVAGTDVSEDFLREPARSASSSVWGPDVGGLAVCRRTTTGPYDVGVGCAGATSVVWMGAPRGGPEPATELDVAGRLRDARFGDWLARQWQLEGHGCLERVGGPIACVVREGGGGKGGTARVTVLRDRLGLIPWWVGSFGGRLWVGSHPGWLLRRAGRRPRPDRRRLLGFMRASMDTARNDYLAGLQRLRPAEWLCWSRGDVRQRGTYWSPSAPLFSRRTPEELADGFTGRLSAAQQSTAESIDSVSEGDHPWLHMLSGGLDSTSLMALDAERVGRGSQTGSGASLPAASMISPGFPDFDESRKLDSLEERFDLGLRRFDITELNLFDCLEVIEDTWAFGPSDYLGDGFVVGFLDAVLPRFETRRVMMGIDADGLLWETPGRILRSLVRRHQWGRLMQRSREWGVGPVANRLAARLVEGTLGDAWRSRLAALKRDVQTSRPAPSWLRPGDWTIPIDGWGGLDRVPLGRSALGASRASGADQPRRHALDRRASWAWERVQRSIQRQSRHLGCRFVFPFLDHRVWEYGLRIPPDFLLRSGLNKYVLRLAMRGRLPETIRATPKSAHLDPLIERDLGARQRDIVDRLFETPRLADLGLLDPAVFRGAFRDYCAAVADRRSNPDRPALGSFGIWRTVAAELWLRALETRGGRRAGRLRESLRI